MAKVDTHLSSVMTPEFRAAMAYIFTPKKNEKKGIEPKFMVRALFKKGEDLTALKNIANAALIRKFGADPDKYPKNLRTPFRDQGEKSYEGYVDGAVFINFSSKSRPGLVDANVKPIIDPSQFYSGCYARAVVHAYGYDYMGNSGVAFELENIQKIRDGEPLSDRVQAEHAFAPIGDAIDTDAASFFGN